MATALRKCKEYIFGCKTLRKKYNKLSESKIFQVSNKCFLQTSITCYRFFVSSSRTLSTNCKLQYSCFAFLSCFLSLSRASRWPMYGKSNTKCHCFPFLPSQFMDLWHFQKTVDTPLLPQFPTQLLFTVNLSTKRQEGVGSRLSGRTNPKKKNFCHPPSFHISPTKK